MPSDYPEVDLLGGQSGPCFEAGFGSVGEHVLLLAISLWPLFSGQELNIF